MRNKKILKKLKEHYGKNSIKEKNGRGWKNKQKQRNSIDKEIRETWQIWK